MRRDTTRHEARRHKTGRDEKRRHQPRRDTRKQDVLTLSDDNGSWGRRDARGDEPRYPPGYDSTSHGCQRAATVVEKPTEKPFAQHSTTLNVGNRDVTAPGKSRLSAESTQEGGDGGDCAEKGRFRAVPTRLMHQMTDD